MYDKYGQFIDGKWIKSASGETYDVINPATEEVIGKASKANSSDVQKALKSAEKGLEIWRNTSPWERSRIIRKISDLIRKRVEVLSKWLTLEVGKPLTEGPGEIGGAADIFEWNSEETKRIFGEINQSRSCLLSTSWCCCGFSSMEFSNYPCFKKNFNCVSSRLFGYCKTRRNNTG